MKNILDLTQKLPELGYQNQIFSDTAFEPFLTFDKDGWSVEIMTHNLHVGTHVDAAYHIIPEAKPIDEYPLERFVGDAVIVDLFDSTPDMEITSAHLKKYDELITEGCTVFLCTGWSGKRNEKERDLFLNHAPFLGADGAQYLIDKKVSGVATEHYAVDSSDTCAPTHLMLLQADILIFEDLLITKEILKNPVWKFVALPLPLRGMSGSPIRIMVYED